jgi:uridine kinase
MASTALSLSDMQEPRIQRRFLLRPDLVESWDVKIFVSASFDETLRRALVRDRDLFGSEAEVERRYRHRYIPGRQL